MGIRRGFLVRISRCWKWAFKFLGLLFELLSAVNTANMCIKFFNVCCIAILATVSALTVTAASLSTDEERIARLEARLLESELRLSDTEQETKEVKVLASSAVANGGDSSSILGNAATFDILAGSAWRNLRWTQEDQWDGIRRGVTEEQVVEILGHPPRSVKSMKPRVDMVYWYETSIRDRSNSLRGKISFKDGKVIAIQKPNFKAQTMAN